MCHLVILPGPEDLRKKFKEIQKEKSPVRRCFYGYATTVTDTITTAITLETGPPSPSFRPVHS